MTGFYFGVLALLLVLDLAVTVHLSYRILAPGEEERNERAVEQAMKAAADPMDEGFENIMRFSVNGKTGFEQE